MELKDIGQVVEGNLLEKMFSLLKLPFNPNKIKFVGNHPISLTIENIPLLLNKDYMVCEKTDGIRAMLYVTVEDGETFTYFYDRKNEFVHLKTGIKVKNESVFDGELFYDKKGLLNYAIFDCVLFEGELVNDKNLLKRLFYCEEFVKNISKEESNGIRIYLKPYYKSYGLLEIYKQIKTLQHENDGLIFTPVYEPYVFQKRGAILKWKPPCINTVDFKIEQVEDKKGIYSLKCSFSNSNDLVIDYFVYEEEKNLNNCIGEFKFEKEKIVLDYENLCIKKGGWVLYKIRTDKDTPNHFRVVGNILNSLDEDLDIEELSRYFKPMRSNYKLREGKGI